METNPLGNNWFYNINDISYSTSVLRIWYEIFFFFLDRVGIDLWSLPSNVL